MSILLVGLNHKSAPVAIRERLSLSCREGVEPLQELRCAPVIREALYLATCNRVEFVVVTDDSGEAERMLRDLVLHHGNLPRDVLGPCLYRYEDDQAVCHLFRVAASLDSMVVGEPQILGQVKEAYRHAVEQRTNGILLNRILHQAFRVAKRVRTETGIAQNAVSVSFVAVELAKKIFGSLAGKTVLLVGAGEMSELAARHLINQGVTGVTIVNRTYDRARQLAARFHGSAVPFEELQNALQDCDIVITSTGAARYVIDTEMIAAALHRRKNRLLFLIDIAVPRDIDPAVAAIDNVFLYNIDNLQDVVDENVKIRQQESEKAETIIAEEVARYLQWIHQLQVVPTIVSLRAKADQILRAEWEKNSSWMQSLSPADRERMAGMVQALINKVLHDPITGLKEESRDGEALPYVAALRRLFKLEGPS